MGKTSWQVKSRYNRKSYDAITINVRKDSGVSVATRAAAEAAGQSLTAYIVQAIDERMQRDGFQPFNVAEVTAEALKDEQPPT